MAHLCTELCTDDQHVEIVDIPSRVMHDEDGRRRVWELLDVGYRETGYVLSGLQPMPNDAPRLSGSSAWFVWLEQQRGEPSETPQV